MRRTAAFVPGLLLAAGIVGISDAQKAPATAPQTEVGGRDRVVITGMAPIPDVGEGAPRFTAKEVEAIEKEARKTAAGSQRDWTFCRNARDSYMPPSCPAAPRGLKELVGCELEYATKVANLASKAARASEAAEAVRRTAAAGEADMKAVEVAELERQEAVNKMQEGRQKLLETRAVIGDVQKGILGFAGWDPARQEMKRKKAGWGLGVAVPDAPPGLSIVNVSVVQHHDIKGEFVRVRGDVRNSGAKTQSIPGLAATLVDVKGFPLNTTSVESAKKRSIRPGQTRPFQFDMRPAPQETLNAIVTFAPEGAPQPRMRMNGVLCPRQPATGPNG